MNMPPKKIITARNIHQEFDGREVLQGVDIDIHDGFTLITGASGSGKTTLMNILGGLMQPTTGLVMFRNTEVSSMNEDDATRWRGAHTGFAFQRSGLLPGLTAAENIRTPHELIGNELDREWAGTLCARLGIGHILKTRAGKLSGGEKQRVALAKSLVHKPEVLFADEPSASLDSGSKVELHEIVREVVDEMGVTIVMVSHDKLSLNYADRVVELMDGRILSDQHHVLQAAESLQ